MARPRPFVLTILDGWGHSPEVAGNAIAQARKPNFDRLWSCFPHTLIDASGTSVGLPEGQIGNSEAGHLNIGAGRVVPMDVTRVDQMIADGEFFRNAVLTETMRHARNHRLHLVGMVSRGGVHAEVTHLYALLRMARDHGVQKVYCHCITDGRDAPPQSAAGYIQELLQHAGNLGNGRLATICGRYYAMDRDGRWDRTERAFRAMVRGEGAKAADAVQALQDWYARGVTDEFIEPTVLVDAQSEPVGLIRNGDAVILFNFRSDRARQMTRAFCDPTLDRPPQGLVPRDLRFVTMTDYGVRPAAPCVVPPSRRENILGEVFAGLGWTNLRIAETEKYPHVTYFFNGGIEQPFPGEQRIHVPSPRVATYDLQPEMSAPGITEAVLREIAGEAFDVIVMNFANPDMVGHSGRLRPTIQAIGAVDSCLGRLWKALEPKRAAWMITADHGKAEVMVDTDTGTPRTYHTMSPVPLILIDGSNRPLRPGGSLRDVAPTLLGVLGVPPPAEMTGSDLRL